MFYSKILRDQSFREIASKAEELHIKLANKAKAQSRSKVKLESRDQRDLQESILSQSFPKTKSLSYHSRVEVKYQSSRQMRLKQTSCIVADLAKAFAKKENTEKLILTDTHSLHLIPISFHTNSTAADNMHPIKLF